jgi:4-amino-4-deoxy-L-arabinose transferase-like glycosyltransferase
MRRRGAVLVFAVHALCLGATAGSFDSGSHPDEETYAAISAELARGGDWLVPRLEGEPVFFKPPLLYQVQAASLRLLGPSVFAVRLPSVLATLATALLLWRFLLGQGLPRRAALTRASMLLSTFGVLRFGVLGMMDALFMLALAVGLAAVLNRRRGWPLAAATATLLKGPVGALLAGALAGPVAWRQRRSAREVVGALALVSLLATPWFAFGWWRFGEDFIAKFLVTEHLAKLASPRTVLGELSLLTLPLVVAAPWVLVLRWRRQHLAALVGPALFLGVYLLQASRQLHYGLPLVPVLLAIPRGVSPGAMRWLGGLVLGLGLLALGAAGWVDGTELRSLAVLLAVGAGVLGLALWRRRLRRASLALAVTWAAVFGGWTRVVLPPTWPRELAAAARGERVWLQAEPVGIGALESGVELHRGLAPPGELVLRPATGGPALRRWSRLRQRTSGAQVLGALRGGGLPALCDEWELARSP